MLPKTYEFIGFGAMDATKPYGFIGFGAMDAPFSKTVTVASPRSPLRLRAGAGPNPDRRRETAVGTLPRDRPGEREGAKHH